MGNPAGQHAEAEVRALSLSVRPGRPAPAVRCRDFMLRGTCRTFLPKVGAPARPVHCRLFTGMGRSGPCTLARRAPHGPCSRPYSPLAAHRRRAEARTRHPQTPGASKPRPGEERRSPAASSHATRRSSTATSSRVTWSAWRRRTTAWRRTAAPRPVGGRTQLLWPEGVAATNHRAAR